MIREQEQKRYRENRDDAEELGFTGVDWDAGADRGQRARTRARWQRAGVGRKDTGRRTGAMVSVLRADLLVEAARAVHSTGASGLGRDLSVAFAPGPVGTFRADKGDRVAVVNSEGVGHLDADGAVMVAFAGGAGIVELPIPLEVIDAATTDEVLDLAELIRPHGRRLDENHAAWRARHYS